MTLGAQTCRMADRRSDATKPPLASYVLRVTGQPAVLRYELHDVRTGQRHRFLRADALLAFLRAHGIADDPLQLAADDIAPDPGDDRAGDG